MVPRYPIPGTEVVLGRGNLGLVCGNLIKQMIGVWLWIGGS